MACPYRKHASTEIQDKNFQKFSVQTNVPCNIYSYMMAGVREKHRGKTASKLIMVYCISFVRYESSHAYPVAPTHRKLPILHDVIRVLEPQSTHSISPYKEQL